MQALIVIGGGILMAILFAVLLSVPIWLTWNACIPAIFKLPEITLLQSLCLNLLVGLLFKTSASVKA